MIRTLLLTLFLESLVFFCYCRLRRKRLLPIWVTSLWANVVTQLFLWAVLTLFFHSYLIVLFLAEALIWAVEALVLSAVPANRLTFHEAAVLSLLVNLLSFGIGWFLPL